MQMAIGADYEKYCSWKDGEFEISTDPARIDFALVHQFLTNSYWALSVPLETVQRSVQHSLCFSIHHGPQQVGFARAVTDHATFAYIADVFVTEPYRGRGLAKWLMQCVKSHPDLQGLRRWMLATRDAHGLYQQFGFTQLSNPDPWMEIHNARAYKSLSEANS